MVIKMATKLLHDTQSVKVVHLWRLEGQLERIKDILDSRMTVPFNHVRRLGNKVAYQLVNLGTETHRAVKTKD